MQIVNCQDNTRVVRFIHAGIEETQSLDAHKILNIL